MSYHRKWKLQKVMSLERLCYEYFRLGVQATCRRLSATPQEERLLLGIAGRWWKENKAKAASGAKKPVRRAS